MSCVPMRQNVLERWAGEAAFYFSGQFGIAGQMGRVTAPGPAVNADKASLRQSLRMIGARALRVRTRPQVPFAAVCKLWRILAKAATLQASRCYGFRWDPTYKGELNHEDKYASQDIFSSSGSLQ